MCQLCGASLERMATRSRSNPGSIADVLTVLGPNVQPHEARKPCLFKVPAPGGLRYRELHRLITARTSKTSASRPRGRTSAGAGSAARPR